MFYFSIKCIKCGSVFCCPDHLKIHFKTHVEEKCNKKYCLKSINFKYDSDKEKNPRKRTIGQREYTKMNFQLKYMKRNRPKLVAFRRFNKGCEASSNSNNNQEKLPFLNESLLFMTSTPVTSSAAIHAPGITQNFTPKTSKETSYLLTQIQNKSEKKSNCQILTPSREDSSNHLWRSYQSTYFTATSMDIIKENEDSENSNNDSGTKNESQISKNISENSSHYFEPAEN